VSLNRPGKFTLQVKAVGKTVTRMFTNCGKLLWLPVQHCHLFVVERKKIDKLFLLATQEAARPDGVNGRTMSHLSEAANELHNAIDSAVDAMALSDNGRAESSLTS
jgi:hypothetical protein